MKLKRAMLAAALGVAPSYIRRRHEDELYRRRTNLLCGLSRTAQ
jgi:hypothetical protein